MKKEMYMANSLSLNIEAENRECLLEILSEVIKEIQTEGKYQVEGDVEDNFLVVSSLKGKYNWSLD